MSGRNPHARHIEDCVILANDEIAPRQFRMRLYAPHISGDAIAGQFCMVEVSRGLHPFLRRPMGFERILHDGFHILYKVEGQGTALMAQMAPDQTVSIQGPLGNGFTIDNAAKRHILVAGGVGVAPFPALADAIIAASHRPPSVILAARSRSMLLCEEEFTTMGCPLHIATDDGSAGSQAMAHEVLARLLPGPGDAVYVCGPMVMMRATARVVSDGGAQCQVSLEARMACGDGACLGCVVESTREQEGEKMVRVCQDGPVFDAEIIDWDAHDYGYDA